MTPFENIWNVPSEVALGPSLASPEELYVRWSGPEYWVQATVVKEMGAPVVKAFECEALSGTLPPEARRLPSDALVMDALRRLGPRGLGPLVVLLGEGAIVDRYVQEVARDDVATGEGGAQEGVPTGKFPLEEAVEKYGRLVVRRPRSQIQQQVNEVRRWRAEGMKTDAIAGELMHLFGLSRRTAYRRIAAAEAGVPADEDRGEV